MSFVNAAKEAMDQYWEDNPPEKKKQNKPLNQEGLANMFTDNFPYKGTSRYDVTPEQALYLEALAYAREAEKIFGGDPNYDWRNNPNDFRVKLGNSAEAVLDSVSSALDGDDATSSQAGSAAKPTIYSDWTPAASYFGMDQSTAYAEHMANTAHQREVADLKAAGLNPVLGISGAGASGVSGSMTTGASSAQKGISSDALVDLFGATASVITMLVSKDPSLGLAVGKVAQAGGNLLFGE